MNDGGLIDSVHSLHLSAFAVVFSAKVVIVSSIFPFT